ncbi:helix-turn-helix domain-containing protein [Bradyrhizobium huanghuaihaiense]|uniref:helix-turn-helix domain-containing protein n=1 Tax=Bradyrhizobium huanghuaihaiense TaxID=990078 RepID=UPI0021AAD0A8|nr:helix-turn-helix transcriptional regulator [Bradyrhizobium sp. CB3035]UWU76014.1 helix-turn-helix domain-containing protein [Bradyrhizobium sp. CB3035]
MPRFTDRYVAPVTFQQIQKYENGLSRIAAADLARLAVALRCQLVDFFAPDDSQGDDQRQSMIDRKPEKLWK